MVPIIKMHFEDRLSHIIELGFTESALPQLKAYIELLWQANEDLNLVSRKMQFSELIDNHVIDCLLPLKYFPKNTMSVADFGTGGGLPAIIYALQFPKIHFHLFEKSSRKKDFLKRCQTITENIHIHSEIPAELKNIDLVIARGFKPLDILLEISRNYYKGGGKYFLLKARRDKIDAEITNSQKTFRNLKVTVQPLQSPVLEVERHLLLIN